MTPTPPAGYRSPFSRRQLIQAAQHVVSQRRVPGIDGLWPQQLDGKRVGQLCQQLHQMLAGGRWKPMPARRGILLRRGKSSRLHAIATMRDAIVQRAALTALADVWKALPPEILGGRPGGKPQTIVHAIGSFLATGGGWVVRCDCRGAFANAPFDDALGRARALTNQREALELLAQWRAAQGDKFRGLVEGSTAAPLLLATLLKDTVVALRRFGVVLVWMDDAIVLCRSEDDAREAHETLVAELDKVKLKPHPKKTGVYQAEPSRPEPTEWNFVGFRFRGWLPEPTPEAVQGLFDEVSCFVESNRLDQVTAHVKGWLAYFALPNAHQAALSEVESRLWPWGPFASPKVATNSRKGAVLRGPVRPRAGRLQLPGVSGGFLR